MTIVTSKTFTMEDGEQAVLLPDHVAYGDGVELTITRSADVLTLRPAAANLPDDET